MQKVVIDTSVIVSALICSSYPNQIIFNLVFNKKIIVCSSLEIFAEYVEVLNRSKFLKYPEFVSKAEIVLNKIDELSLIFQSNLKLLLVKDLTDNKFLETAITA